MTGRARVCGGRADLRRLAGACLLVVPLPFVTQIEGGDRGLRGLPGVAVIGEATAPELRPYGVTEDWLMERASRLLDRAGVPRLTRSDAFSASRQPLLVIRLQSIRLPGSRTFAWSLSLSVCQKMVTLAAPPDTILSQAWAATETIGVTGGPQLKGSVGETLEHKIAEFVKAWASQRRQAAPRP